MRQILLIFTNAEYQLISELPYLSNSTAVSSVTTFNTYAILDRLFTNSPENQLITVYAFF